MSTLSELVKLRNTLEKKLESIDFSQAIDSICNQLLLVISENHYINDQETTNKINKAINEYQNLIKISDNIQDNLKLAIEDLDARIGVLSSQINAEFICKNPEHKLIKNIFQLDAVAHQTIQDHMIKYADWHYPGLRLGCRNVGQYQITQDNNQLVVDYTTSIDYTNLLVVNDPLYFCDFCPKLIENVTGHFNKLYASRIRKYIIKDHDLSELPQNQIGFVFSWMFFNYVDISTLKLYLQSIINLLRPGGTFMFSYNNTDIPSLATASEHGIMSSIPQRQLITLIETVGFEIITMRNIPNSDRLVEYISWVEIQKPGNLHSIKLNQVLGTIASK